MKALDTTRRRRLVAIFALSSVIGLIAGGLNSGRLSLLPPGLKDSGLAAAVASTHVFVDLPRSHAPIAEKRALTQEVQGLTKRAEFAGRVLATQPLLERVAKTAAIPAAELSGVFRVTGNVPLAISEPASERRASDIREASFAYRIEVQSRAVSPVFDVYAQAPTDVEAIRMADAAVPALQAYFRELAEERGLPADQILTLRQLGAARGGPAGTRSPLIIGVLTFIITFGLVALALSMAIALRQRQLAGLPLVALTTATPQNARPRVVRSRSRRPQLGDWPRTTRLLPWSIAAFIALMWLVPFHSIKLNVPAPVEMTLDRLLLPVVIAMWLLALAARGALAPKLRLTWIHVAAGVFLACAFLSVVLDARTLSNTLEFDLSLKKLPLLFTYIALFMVVSTGVRLSEVKPFLTFSLVLGVICGVGVIFEYRFKQNIFFLISDAVLPGIFVNDGALDGGAVDHMGRRVVRGPAEVPLEAVTMMSLVLPVALVGILQSKRWRQRVFYAIAACLLMAAMFATFRKSALLAPISVVATLAWFRRREMLRLAPLALVLVVVISALSPGALGSTLSQFTRADALNVPTVSDRASDYDAVRPDVWSHLAFGRGWGSYSHVDYRILDSEILHRLIEMGIVGLLAYLFLPIAVIATSRAAIAARGPVRAPLALAGACAGVAFIAASTFYDVMSFPHAAYVFLYIAGLIAVVVGSPEPPDSRVARFRPRRAVRGPLAEKESRVPVAVGE